MARATILIPFHECSGEPIFREARSYSDYLADDGQPYRSYDRNGNIMVPSDAIYPVHAVNMACMTCGQRWHKIEFSDGSAKFEPHYVENSTEPAAKRSWLARLGLAQT